MPVSSSNPNLSPDPSPIPKSSLHSDQDRSFKILPSILSADFANLERDVAAVEACGIEMLHFDAMDGRFVPNISIGLPVLRSLRAATDLFIDAHLMIVEPERYAGAFAEAGADCVTVHVEAATHLHRIVQDVRGKGAKVGVALNPATALSSIEAILPELDLVLLMTVNPGFGGQGFIRSVLPKIRELRQRIQAQGLDVEVQIDGGVGPDTIYDAVQAGAQQLVAGSAVYAAGQAIPDAIQTLYDRAAGP